MLHLRICSARDRTEAVAAVLRDEPTVCALAVLEGACLGVFISVTTIPAAANLSAGLAFGLWDEARGSLIQLVVDVVGMALAGWLTLVIQHAVWSRFLGRRR